MTSRYRFTLPVRLFLAWMAVLMVGSSGANPVVGEPETLVYGRILNRRNANLDQLVTSGSLTWSILKPDGSTLELTGQVDSFDNGRYSYLVRIPHQAMMIGQQTAPEVLPLGIVTSTAVHKTITFNGTPAAILAPATSVFDLDQILRASALRIDLEINADNTDLDGDGMPDWWEDANGLDKQNAGDALTDANGNGLNNRGEYLAGTDPKRDSKLPLLVTKEVIAYSESKSIVLLETVDTDSTPAQLVYTLVAAPETGHLKLRNATANPAASAVTLAAGATFTQADVLAGRLIYDHATGEAPAPFEVSVVDQTPDHPASTGQVAVLLFDPSDAVVPASAAESVRLEARLLARDEGHIVADLGSTTGRHRLGAPTTGLSSGAYPGFAATYGPELPHVILGGPSDDTLSGGAVNDFLYGGEGANTLAGDAGADTFIFTGNSALRDTLTDFTPSQGDVIDLSGVLHGTSTRLTDYVRLVRSGADALLEISATGTGNTFTDRVLVLKNSTLQPADLLNLYYGGNLGTGPVGMPARVTVAATTPQASENGPVSGEFTVTREGDTSLPLTVGLAFSGTATLGVDYHSIPSSVTIPAGMAAAVVRVLPYVDSGVEGAEQVGLTLVSSAAYLIGAASTAEISIEDLKPQLSLEVLEGIAGVADGTPAAVRVLRSGLTGSEIFVQFTLTGTATNGTHYNNVTRYFTMPSGQTSKVVEFVPKASVTFGTAEARTIKMTIQPDAAYSVMVPTANLVIVPKRLTYDEWVEQSGHASSAENLLGYAFSTSSASVPFNPLASSRYPKGAIENGYLTLRFRKKPGITDMDYRVEYSNNAYSWFSGPSVVEDITAQAAPNDPGAAVYRAKLPVSARPAAAMRVKLVPASEENP